MSTIKSAEPKPLVRKRPESSKSGPAAAKSLVKVQSGKNKKTPTKGKIVRLHKEHAKPAAPAPSIPWWVAPQAQGTEPEEPSAATRALTTPGTIVPGLFPPGPFPPGPGPFPPGPGPLPIPLPLPVPQPIPPAFITVRIVGGALYPNIGTTTYIPFYPGITIRQALESTGLVGFGPLGAIRSVSGIPVGGNTVAQVRYNGRVIPQALFNSTIIPGSMLTVELLFTMDGSIPVPL